MYALVRIRLAQFGKIYLSYQNSISFMLFLLMLPPSGKLIKEPSQGSGGFLARKPERVQNSELYHIIRNVCMAFVMAGG